MVAVVAAATGAITVGGAAATTDAAGSVSAGRVSLTEQALHRSTALTAEATADALALRSEEATERSSQRDQLTTAAAKTQDAAQAQTQAELAALDAITVERTARVPAPPPSPPPPPAWVIPVAGYRVTSLYGSRWGGMHAGVDLAAPSGTPIVAMGDGKIVEAGWSGGYGQRTIVRHADGTETWYCHQSAFEVTGGSVTAGQVIGYVGNTGNSTGPHLHLEVHPGGGDAINPSPWIEGLGLSL